MPGPGESEGVPGCGEPRASDDLQLPGTSMTDRLFRNATSVFSGRDEAAAAPVTGPAGATSAVDEHGHVPGVREGVHVDDAQTPLPTLRARALRQVQRPGGADNKVWREQTGARLPRVLRRAPNGERLGPKSSRATFRPSRFLRTSTHSKSTTDQYIFL